MSDYVYGQGEYKLLRPRRPAPHVILRRKATAVRPLWIIQGQRASDLEARVYRALLALGWTDDNVDFQTNILGGRMPGGQVLDFVLRGWGETIVIAIDGDYWHRASEVQIQRDREKRAAIAAVWSRPFQFISLGSGDLLTDQMAYQRLLLLVGRGH